VLFVVLVVRAPRDCVLFEEEEEAEEEEGSSLGKFPPQIE
jgi:hypothetical protein